MNSSNMMVTILVVASLFLVQVSTSHSIHPRIANGVDTFRGQFPFMASMQLGVPGFFFAHLCSGVIYNNYWILTVAHCVNNLTGVLSARVKVGKYFTEKDDKYVQVLKIAQKIVHEDYESFHIDSTLNPHGVTCKFPPAFYMKLFDLVCRDPPIFIWKLPGFLRDFIHSELGQKSRAFYMGFFGLITAMIYYDIGLIKTETKIIMNRYVQKAKLYQQPDLSIAKLLMLGWGRTSAGYWGNVPFVLQLASVGVLEHHECLAHFSQYEPPIQLLQSHICTYTPSKEVTACMGDSGGAIIYYGDEGSVVVGLISAILPFCGAKGVPAITTLVSPFNGWINHTTAEYS